MNTPDQTTQSPSSSSAESTSRLPRSDIPSVGVYGLAFFSLAGPALSFGQWGEWGALKWMLKVFEWLSIPAGCLVAIADLRIRRMLRFTPWVAGMITVSFVWLVSISHKPILQAVVPLTWFATVTVWFTYLRLRVPEFFGLPRNDRLTNS